MGKFSALDYQVTVGGVDLSDHIDNVELPIEVDEVETTAFGGDGWRERVGGLKSANVTLNFHQDFAAGEVDATLWPLLGTVATVTLRPTTAAISATNPEYSVDVVVAAYAPLSGGVGELSTTSVTWPSAGPVTRATA